MLHGLDIARETDAVRDAVQRFNLDPANVTDILAARAYVWGKNMAPAAYAGVPWNGPENERVAQGLMRYEQAHPGTLGRAYYGGADATARRDEVVKKAMAGEEPQAGPTQKPEDRSRLGLPPVTPQTQAQPIAATGGNAPDAKPQRAGPDPTTKPDGPQLLPQAPTEHKGYAFVTHNQEEADLVASLMAQGKSQHEIQSALDDLRSRAGSAGGAGKPGVIKLSSENNIAGIQPMPTTTDGKPVVNWKLYDSESGAVFADVDVNMEDPANPGPPDQDLTPRTAKLPSGEIVRLEAPFPFTNASLKKNIEIWEKYFGKPLEDLSGSLAWKNLENFQREYAKIRDEKKKSGEPVNSIEIGNEAIRRVSFGRARIDIGYGNLTVEFPEFQDVMIDGIMHKDIPTKIKASAKKPQRVGE